MNYEEDWCYTRYSSGSNQTLPVILELKSVRNLTARSVSLDNIVRCLIRCYRFQVIPDVDLDLMRPNQSLGGLTSRAIEALDRYLAEDKPDVVLVQGIQQRYYARPWLLLSKIPIAHVEAGLRTWNMASPWPEEANRV